MVRFAVGTLLLFTACDGDLTELVVVVETDYAVPGELDEIVVEVSGPSGTPVMQTASFGGPDAPSLPIYLYVEPSGDELGAVEAIARGRISGVPLVETRVQTEFVRDESRMIVLRLLRSCMGVDCGGDSVCDASGCRPVVVPPAELLPWPGQPPPRTDGGVECAPGPELCNGLDDDCDDNVDEEYDLQSDTRNCGSCDNTCSTGANAAPACVAGDCETACLPGFADCDSDPGNGCETDLSSPTTCGSCANACAPVTPLCDGSACLADCRPGTIQCGTSCVDTATSLTHCGACDAPCAPVANGSPLCRDGDCEATCDGGFEDCDSDLATGCEADLRALPNCGSCGNSCPLPNASSTCIMTTCAISSCAMGFDDCDRDASNGCEGENTMYYFDGDGDGYGRTTMGLTSTCPPLGFVPDSGDCDDSNPMAFPGATEICNAIDDNCDGSVDEHDMTCGDTCMNPIEVFPIAGQDVFLDNLDYCGQPDSATDSTCNSSGVSDDVFLVHLPMPGRITVETMGFLSDSVILYRGTSCPGMAIDCDRNDGPLFVGMLPAGDHYFVIESESPFCMGGRYDVEFRFR